ncbi:MAG TPA: 4Fe-4S dicluster domain-containing protein [Polyangiaceae bacterium]|nr:4Fe-4S dicluster domain-containing protein [Polyangiaceae bacterium]HOD24126.1 4Fe-4S dicluster domain-containing protein [Polyangiaceae bacterium]HOE51248.1 4Fe-4S dicluster domain-containing protein [Polyangiaceae bacterium]HOH03251.1 4Fe-4S dicluster domain-containing protein [Polyangiaceae bacterium]HOR37253.1 4Fe-4S dicluster domain-containing protein [Polyangiaceae bacterium]
MMESAGRTALRAAIQANYESCLSCHACRTQCPVHVATGLLAPLGLLRMAALGMGERLKQASELWYCLQCRRCTLACPSEVAPSTLIRRMREQGQWAGGEGEVAFKQLQRDHQRVRWHLANALLWGQDGQRVVDDWSGWAGRPIAVDDDVWELGDAREAEEGLAACMTCGSCTTVCPIAHERAVFDPVRLFRWVNLGGERQVLGSPSLWLCLGCGQCTSHCTQRVDGQRLIEGLRQRSVALGVVPSDMRERFTELDRGVLRGYVREVQGLLGRLALQELKNQ